MRGVKLQVGVDAAVSAIQGVLSVAWLETMILHDAVLVPKIGTI